MRFRIMCVVFALALLAGCGSDVDCTPVATPAGYFAKACVIEVPSGSTVSSTDAGTTVYAPDGGVIAVYPPCQCPRR